MRLPDRVDLTEAMAHSFRDLHAKGLDYVCLRRSLEETWKLYFFDGDVSLAPEVVNPHDHRYNFDTQVLSGCVDNVTYREVPEGTQGSRVYNRFEWRTPLNDGPCGFTYSDRVSLEESDRRMYGRHGRYFMEHAEIHTLQVREPRTVLFLRQFQDVVPVGEPTKTYVRGAAPTIAGLYRRFTVDALLDRLQQFEAMSGIRLDMARSA